MERQSKSRMPDSAAVLDNTGTTGTQPQRASRPAPAHHDATPMTISDGTAGGSGLSWSTETATVTATVQLRQVLNLETHSTEAAASPAKRDKPLPSSLPGFRDNKVTVPPKNVILSQCGIDRPDFCMARYKRGLASLLLMQGLR